MKAIIYTKYGKPDALELKGVEKPTPNDKEVLIKVQASSINEWDWRLMQGKPFINRLLCGPLKPERQILGADTGQFDL